MKKREWTFDRNDPKALDRTLRSLGSNHVPRTLATYLFEGYKPERPLLELGALIGFAWNGYTAKQCRLAGDTPSALVYEQICDRIYEDMPRYETPEDVLTLRDYADMLSIEQDLEYPKSAFRGLV